MARFGVCQGSVLDVSEAGPSVAERPPLQGHRPREVGNSWSAGRTGAAGAAV